MKKLCSILLALIFAFISVSCVNGRKEPPYGVWESQDPHLIIYFDPEYSTRGGYGCYYKDGEEIEVIILQGDTGNFDVSKGTENPSTGLVVIEETYFFGLMKVEKDGKLYYTMKGTYPETTGYDVIVFDKIEDR